MGGWLDWRRFDMEAHAFALLQKGHNLEQIIRARIARGSEHAHKALRGNVGRLGEFCEADGRVDVVAENGLRGRDVAAEHAFDAFAQKLLAELWIAFDAGAYGFLKVAGQTHVVLPIFSFYNPANRPLDVLLLPLLGAAAKENDETLAIFAEVDSVAGSEIDAALEHTRTDFDVRRVAPACSHYRHGGPVGAAQALARSHREWVA